MKKKFEKVTLNLKSDADFSVLCNNNIVYSEKVSESAIQTLQSIVDFLIEIKCPSEELEMFRAGIRAFNRVHWSLVEERVKRGIKR